MFKLDISSMNGFLSGILDGILNPFKDFVEYVASLFGLFLFSIWTSVAQVLDCIQVIFQMLVGVQPVVYQSNSLFKNSGNLIMDIIMHPFVYNAFLRILVISFFLLLIFTFIAVIKNEYSSESTKGQGNSKGAIIGKSLKALFSFFFIPIVCMFGIIASSYLLQALDYATAPTESTVISNQLFYASAYSCNRARIDDKFYRAMMGEAVDDYDMSLNNMFFMGGSYPNQNALADAIDKAFIAGTPFAKFKAINSKVGDKMTMGDRFDNYIDKCWIMQDNSITKDTYLNTKNGRMVYYFYDLSQFNWIIALFSIFFLGGILTSITLGAAVRLYELAILFIISPAILALMPLDDGNAFKSWKKKFVGKVVMVFAPVVALNLYFILINTLLQIDVSATLSKAINSGLNMVSIGSMGLSLHGYLVQQVFSLFICIAGAMVVKESIKWLSEMIGGEDLMGAGDKLRKGVKDFVTTNAALAGGAAATKFIAGKTGSWGKGKLTDGLNRHNNKSESKGELRTAKNLKKEQKEKLDNVDDRLNAQLEGKALHEQNATAAAMNLGLGADKGTEMRDKFYDDFKTSFAETGDYKHAYEVANENARNSLADSGMDDQASVDKMLSALKADNQARIMKMDVEERKANIESAKHTIKANYANRKEMITSGKVEQLRKEDAMLNKKIEQAQKDIEEHGKEADKASKQVAKAFKSAERSRTAHAGVRKAKEGVLKAKDKVSNGALAGGLREGLKAGSEAHAKGSAIREAERGRNIENRERNVVEDRTHRQ